jgi:hypothetical protein
MGAMDAGGTAMSLCLGVGLAAACGFRVFLPPLLVALALAFELIPAGTMPAWLGTWPAITALAAASALELGAYYVPWIDNALDAVASPVAVVAGMLMTAGATADLDPAVQWTAAVIAGGGAAGLTQTATVLTRGLSTLSTGGLSNFLVSTLEWIGAVLVTAMTLLIAPAALLVLALAVLWLVRTRRRRAAARQAAGAT